MSNYYKGSVVKFSIELSAPGFSMDDNNFEIEVKSGNTSVKGNKTNTTGSSDVIIFRDPALSDDSSSGTEGPVWFGIVKTEKLVPGELKVIGTAFIPDGHADSGIRPDIAVDVLGRLLPIS